jgi:hypothetical protein
MVERSKSCVYVEKGWHEGIFEEFISSQEISKTFS